MSIHHALRRAAASALDLVAPPRCLACGCEDAVADGLGRRCSVLLRACPPAPCPVCAGALGPGAPLDACGSCAALRPSFHATCAAALYAGLGGELVRRAKYGGDPVLAWPLAARLVAAVEAWGPASRVDEVVSVPTTRRRRRARGFHLAELLAEPVADALRVPFRPRRLVRVGDPPPQAALTRPERRVAATGTVAVRQAGIGGRLGLRRRLATWIDLRSGVPPDRRRTVLLVDDVLTTGATANACAKALLQDGVQRVVVAVAARA